ncbi:hypothetical protein [Dyadobacter crusticola]|uniref:hypothetical protein n=1 Tax=Dyadobacter crusticola TaxID=292407 RepID=UPI0004E1E373|nr:hypothetical protein [Dyadobacter crusticola]
MKKKVGYTVWKRIDEVFAGNRDLFIVSTAENKALILNDSDPESDFFFEFGFGDGNGRYETKYKPNSPSQVFTTGDRFTEDELVVHLKHWLKILREFQNTPSPYDHPFERQFQKEFYESIKSNDLDADYAAFDNHKMILLYDYLNDAKAHIDNYEGHPKDQAKLYLIRELCSELQENVQNMTKNEAINKLAKIWAKSKTVSISLMKQLLAEFKKGIFKAITDGGMNAGKEIFDYLS